MKETRKPKPSSGLTLAKLKRANRLLEKAELKPKKRIWLISHRQAKYYARMHAKAFAKHFYEVYSLACAPRPLTGIKRSAVSP